jgi:hypothetical protein
MSLAISIRFLTGRAHLHPWQTHHSEGRVEWPPSQWRLLRAFVAIAGRGLTTLPLPDFVVDPGKRPKPTKKNPNPVWPPDGYTSLPDQWHGEGVDEIPLSRLAGLIETLAATPTIWLPKTAEGHTRPYPRRLLRGECHNQRPSNALRRFRVLFECAFEVSALKYPLICVTSCKTST